MPRLTVTEFNTPVFWGRGGNIPGGYGYYQPHKLCGSRTVTDEAGVFNVTCDIWEARVDRLIARASLVGRKIIELGCAWGSLVRQLRLLGANAYGLDLSYPISQGIALWPELQPYLIVADARTWLAGQGKNSWDVIISRGFLDCQTDADLAVMIPQMNNIAKSLQIHIVDQTDDPEYYNRKSIEQWSALPFEAGTIILDE